MTPQGARRTAETVGPWIAFTSYMVRAWSRPGVGGTSSVGRISSTTYWSSVHTTLPNEPSSTGAFGCRASVAAVVVAVNSMTHWWRSPSSWVKSAVAASQPDTSANTDSAWYGSESVSAHCAANSIVSRYREPGRRP